MTRQVDQDDMNLDFSAEQEGRYLRVQRLNRDTPWPCKAIGDDCLLPGEWIVMDSEDKLCCLACHEHIASLLWDIWPGI